MGEKSNEDRRLARRFLESRDEEAFARIYSRHNGWLYAFLLRLLAWNTALAQDALQETWLRALRGLNGFRWDSRLRDWLRAIALNHCRELWRARGRAPLPLAADFERAIHRAYPNRDPAAIDLERAIARLPEGYRAVLVLHDVEGYTHEQVGELLGIVPGTSKSQLSRARSSLRGYLKAEER